MTSSNRILQQLFTAIIIGSVLGCILGGIVIAVFAAPSLLTAALPRTATPTDTPFRPATITLAPLKANTSTRVPATSSIPVATNPPDATTISTTVATKVPTSTKTSVPTKTPYPVIQHFMIGRPLIPPAKRIIPNWIYLYGTTRKGELGAHYGEDFDENPTGTPLYAVSDGTVVMAGSDDQPACGDQGKTFCGPFGDYYGNALVIRIAQDYKGQAVYALYGHMSKVTIAKGAEVKAGAPVGEIGAEGVAMGPHLHLEVRLGTNDFSHTRNPSLWLTPIAGRGSLAGRYVDTKGTPIRGAPISILKADGTFVAGTETYTRDTYAPTNSDDDIRENFAVGDLPVGEYLVKIDGKSFVQHVIIEEGKLAFVELGGAP